MTDFLAKYCSPGKTKPLTQKAFDRASLAGSKQFLSEAKINVNICKKQTVQVWSKLNPETVIPKKNEQIRVRTQTQLNMISVVLALVGPYNVDEMTIATYTLNKEALEILKNLVTRKKIKKLNLLVASSYSFRDAVHKQKIISECLALNAGGFEVHLFFVWSHFKITLIKIGAKHYLIEGSMNYSQNNMAEQILIEDNHKMYTHDHKLLNQIMSNKKTNAVEVIC